MSGSSNEQMEEATIVFVCSLWEDHCTEYEAGMRSMFGGITLNPHTPESRLKQKVGAPEESSANGMVAINR